MCAGVLWLCVVGESLYVGLLLTGGVMMMVEQCPCFSLMNKMKISAFAAMCTALSGLCGMVAHMMFTTSFHLAVSIGPEDWRPKTWDYSWSYALAWSSFGTCMGSAVTALNRYTKTIIEFKYKRRNIEKSLMISQQMLELGLPDQMWDMYLTSTPPELPVNGQKPPTGSPYELETDSGAEQQVEAYC
ncbi:unnamed protein product [Menidia menidia]|uniref:(Atlantic silverside) hypothetical protein n=1 Tax=Menidia menidia TaxID=238744 RepID=A0A8S4BBQ5_9TELE|nr:unnamed protein product [Menidia menidia]CAG5935406.1 unnamed protein product [Menidia menidia]